MMFSRKVPTGLFRCADPSKILVPIATPSSESSRQASETEALRNVYIASANAEYPVCLPYAGTESEPYYGTFPVLFPEIFRVLFSVFYPDLFSGFFRKRFRESFGNVFWKSSRNSTGIISWKLYQTIPKSMTESVNDGTDR